MSRSRRRNDVGATAGDVGTVGAELQRKMDYEATRRAEAKYRDKHAFVGEHYNDI